MTQPSFLFARDSHVTEPSELQRLNGQNRRILERLQQGPATNKELSEISLKYTSRISDVRAYLKPLGQDVKVIERDRASGRTVYALREL